MIAVLLLALVTQDDPFDEHLRNVYLERRQAFLASWEAADEPQRELVREVFRNRRVQGVPAVYQLSAQLLTELGYVLDGEAAGVHELPWEQRFACALDLHVLPGAFAAGEAGRGGEVIVRVLPAMTRMFEPLPEEVSLRLIWVGPDGQEIPARREPVHRAAFRMPGFEMYLRAPSSKPGHWSLVPEIEHDGNTGRGVPVRVDCVRDLLGRSDRMTSAAPTDPYQSAALATLQRLLYQGDRDGMAPSITDLLEGGLLPPLLELSSEWAGGETLRLDAGPEQPRELVLVVAPELEEADWIFSGAALDGWSQLADTRGARVLATSVPVKHPGSADLFRLLAGLRTRYPDLPLTLVLRGSAVGRLALARLGASDPPPFDRIVVHTVLSAAAKPRRQFEVPTLILTPLADPAPLVRIPGPGPSLYRRALADPPLVVDRHLGLYVEEWLGALDGLKDR